ncbi:hypothetical protein H6771_03220 [Candidatus Peribacteria bacterium]|nr:hypothetical protein [Candidatus Peribacteria bacterium]
MTQQPDILAQIQQMAKSQDVSLQAQQAEANKQAQQLQAQLAAAEKLRVAEEASKASTVAEQTSPHSAMPEESQQLPVRSSAEIAAYSAAYRSAVEIVSGGTQWQLLPEGQAISFAQEKQVVQSPQRDYAFHSLMQFNLQRTPGSLSAR